MTGSRPHHGGTGGVDLRPARRRRARRAVAVALVWSWLALSLPLVDARRALAGALPVFAAPWIDEVAVDALAIPALVDIDGDGDLDLFVTSYGNGRVDFFRNTGTGASPAFAAVSSNPFGLSAPDSIVTVLDFVDIDGDGDLDVFLGRFFGYASVPGFFQNKGGPANPVFATAVNRPFLGGGAYEGMPALVDIDGDGDFDAFVAPELNVRGDVFFLADTGTSTHAAWFLNSSTHPFGLPADLAGTDPVPTFVDIDDDGDADWFEGFCVDDRTAFAENVGSPASPAFAAVAWNPFGLPIAGRCNRLTFGDVDQDGDLDVFVGDDSGHVLRFSNTGTASSPAFGPPPNPFGLIGHAPAFGDIDGDGDLDVFTGGFFFTNTGDASHPAFAPPAITFGAERVPALADIDGDGDLDGFAGSGPGMCLYRNVGTAQAPLFEHCSLDPFGIPDRDDFAAPAFADIDGDGDLDLFVGDENGYVWFSPNTGSATSPAFGAASSDLFGLTKFPNRLYKTALAFVDLDGDGDLDAFVGSEGGGVLYFANTGTSSSPAFAPAVAVPALDTGQVAGRAVPALVDIDGDGDLDAFVGSSEGDVRFFHNVKNDPLFADGFESGDLSAWSKGS